MLWHGNALSHIEHINMSEYQHFLTPAHKNLITPLCSSLVQSARHDDVHLSIATNTLKEGTTNSQGQIIRIRCTMLTSLSPLPLTRILQIKKCGNYLKCYHTYSHMATENWCRCLHNQLQYTYIHSMDPHVHKNDKRMCNTP
jgi:hypothetical protein